MSIISEMRKTTNLRLGNLVQYGNYSSKVVAIHNEQTLAIEFGSGSLDVFGGEIRNIPLTEELLVDNFGFEKIGFGVIDSFYKIVKVTYAKSEIISLSRNSDLYGLWYLSFSQGDETEFKKMHKNELVFLSNKLKYVHELQNWYYLLTGYELKN